MVGSDIPTAAQDADEPDPRLGSVLGGLYRVDERIGQGGMGTVYRCTHVHLGRPFAVKVLANEVRSSDRAVERLRQEAVTASNLDHDHIVDVVSFDHTADGEVFIVMEHLRGENLYDVITARGPLPTERAVPIAQQVARALGAAHAQHIVHRDLKPENVFLCDKDGVEFVKVLDFGISKVKTADAEQVRVTRTGQLLGTPLYMSPEQAKGEMDVDRRADIYALGCILYEMLSGRPPFDGKNYFQLLWKHGNQPAEPPSAKAPGTPIRPELEAVVMRALEKDPDARFQSMAELEQALAEAAPDEALPRVPLTPSRSWPGVTDPAFAEGAPAPGRRRRRRWIGALAALAVAAAASAAWLLAAPGPDGSPAAESGAPDEAPDEARAPPAETTAAHTAPSGEPAPSEPAPAPAAAEPPAGEAPEQAATEGRPQAAPPTAEVTFVSRPRGAQVHLEDGRALGETPLVAPLPADGVPIRVRFSLRGYRNEWKEVVPKEGVRVRARLRPRAGSDPSRPELPIKREL